MEEISFHFLSFCRVVCSLGAEAIQDCLEKVGKMRNVFHFNLRGNLKQVFETGGKSNGNLGSIIVVLCPSG